jgi:amino acid transporter
MKPILDVYNLLPVLLLVLQTFIFLVSSMVVLRYLKLLQLPYAGMSYSKLLVAVVVLFSLMIISFSDVEAVIQTTKSFRNYGGDFYRNLFIKFSQFILVIVLTGFLFALLCFSAIRLIPGLRQSSETEEDIPIAVLRSSIILIIAILLYGCTKEIIHIITPKYINFS